MYKTLLIWPNWAYSKILLYEVLKAIKSYFILHKIVCEYGPKAATLALENCTLLIAEKSLWLITTTLKIKKFINFF